MPFIKATYNNIKNFFRKTTNVHKNISGIWSLENIGNVSLLMSFENSIIDGNNIMVKLYKSGNWLFREQTLKTKILRLLNYSYLFKFNDDFTKAQIYIKLGRIPIYLPKFISNWTLELKNNQMIRKTSIFGNTHIYISERFNENTIIKEKELYYLNN